MAKNTKSKAAPSLSEVIKPLIKVLDEAPITTAISVFRTKDGLFQASVLRIQDGVVISEEATEPNTRAVALDSAKISFVRNLMDVEL